MSNKLIAVISFVMLLQQAVYGQDIDNMSPKDIRHNRPKYVQTGLGLNRGSMRDFATSPITYKGVLMNYSLGYLKMDSSREVKLSTRFNHGAYRYKRTEGIEVRSRAAQYVLYLNYYRLYRLKGISNDKWNVKLGGMYDVNMDVRINEDLMNAGIGYEVFNTFFLSGKASYRFERKDTETKKFLFIKYKVKPTVRLFSYQLNLPVVNNTIRNGFSYIGNESLNTIPLFKGYEAKTFSGIRFSSELAYTKQMQNGNMYRVSYLWDAYAVGEAFNRFEMANHILEFSLLFHLNKNKQ